jgi:hypothetical protein
MTSKSDMGGERESPSDDSEAPLAKQLEALLARSWRLRAIMAYSRDRYWRPVGPHVVQSDVCGAIGNRSRPQEEIRKGSRDVRRDAPTDRRHPVPAAPSVDSNLAEVIKMLAELPWELGDLQGPDSFGEHGSTHLRAWDEHRPAIRQPGRP